MPTPRGHDEVAAEASRLLQEGLRLLDQRSSEVEAQAQRAEQRARGLVAEAEERARQIVANAQRERAELEEQLGRLRADVLAAHAQLASLRAHQPAEAASVPDAPQAPEHTELRGGPAQEGLTDPGTEAAAEETARGAEPPERLASRPEGEPRWGRPPPAQATKTRGVRSRWLTLLLLLVLLAVAVLLLLAYVASRGRG